MTALRDLGVRPAEAKTAEAACAVAAKTLEGHGRDIPFALLYLTDAGGRHAHLAAHRRGRGGPRPSASKSFTSTWRAAPGRWQRQDGPCSPRSSPTSPLASPRSRPARGRILRPRLSCSPSAPAGRTSLPGSLIAGASSRLRLDDAYLGFLGLVTTQIGTAIANARAYEEEKRGPRPWPNSTGPRPPSSPTSATSSARR